MSPERHSQLMSSTEANASSKPLNWEQEPPLEELEKVWRGLQPHRNNNANQPELPGTKPLPKNCTWIPCIVEYQWKEKSLVLPRLDPQGRGMSGEWETGVVGERNTFIDEGKGEGIGAYVWETRKENNIWNVNKKIQKKDVGCTSDLWTEFFCLSAKKKSTETHKVKKKRKDILCEFRHFFLSEDIGYKEYRGYFYWVVLKVYLTQGSFNK